MSSGTYGEWESPIDAATAASHDGRPDDLGLIGADLWWTAPRPAEGGRRALVRRRPDGTEECPLPAPWNVRNRVMEYGGTPWGGAVVGGEPLVVFTHQADQRLYAFHPDRPGEQPYPLSPVSAVGGGLRWTEPVVHAERGEVWAVLEEFTGEGPADLRRLHAAVPLDGSAAEDRAAVREMGPVEHRFVTGLRPSPDGGRAAWIAWDHPRMPWDGTELRVADLRGDGTLGPARTLVGGPEESVAQVEWAPDGTLLAATDRTGWWNLHRVDPDTGEAVNLCPREEEFAGPLWRIGARWFAQVEGGPIAVLHGVGAQRLGILDPATGEITQPLGHWTEWTPTLAVAGGQVVGIAASARSAHEIVHAPAVPHARVEMLTGAHHDTVDPAYLPEPEARVFTGPGGREVHAHVYPPRHPDHPDATADGPAPYAIWVHGGPTSRTQMVYDLEVAYFTSRGIGVAEVNYGGSTGYGRAYRNRLREQWGVVEVEDCVAVAEGLVTEGAADPRRLAIRGGSAGGWTSAAALTTVSTFACGAISYPILDLAGWSPAGGETHDFESWYLESLVGPHLEVPERYHERSPVHHSDQVTVPFLLMQGLDDPICPPVQCDRFLEALAGRDLPHAYLAFPGESHGFRRLDTLVTCLEAELSLYGQVFGFRPPGVPVLDLTP
ncbi:prolyl oligopeptidase family serine peptidase [Streptomyces sp. NPDC021224]|uniref:S9 family peptidase n=1 Tax=unclassified Streptomyces TaxID=2593676 RepID=UPI00378FA0DB